MTSAERPGRNDPCHCGSGKKYKHCHLVQDEAEAHAARVKAAAEAASTSAEEAAPAKPSKPQPHRPSAQPWKGATGSTHPAFTSKARAPRKVGGS